MEEGEIGQRGQYWVIPFTVAGKWDIRSDLTVHIHGNGEITQDRNVLWQTVNLSPSSGTSLSFSGSHTYGVPWVASFEPYSRFATGHIHVEVLGSGDGT